MKKKVVFLLVSGIICLFPLTKAWCDQNSKELSVTRGEQRNVIAPRTAGCSVVKPDGSPIELFDRPVVGSNRTLTPLSPTIIHYLLPGKGSISGLVWDDLNGNQTPDAGEHGMPGVRVYIDNNSSATYTNGEPSKITDVNGLYIIPRVKAGTKNIAIDTTSLPAGYCFSTSHPLMINLVPNQKVTDADFGISDLSGTISGLIRDQTDNLPIAGVVSYLDLNSDNIYSPGEPHATTDASGHYLIENLPGGSYEVYVDNSTLDAKYHRTPVAGTNPSQVTLVPGGKMTVDFTYLHKATICGSLKDASGQVWSNLAIFIDLNGNGAYDPGEPTVVTDSSGTYCFDELFPGTYTLLLLPNQLPAGYELLLAAGTITVGAGEDSTANFITHQPVSISGIAWDDVSGNGVWEPVETGLAGVTVFLDANNNGLLDGGEPSTLTDATGAYAFTGLQAGEFYVRADDSTLLAAYIRTTTANPVHIVLAPGARDDGARFGYQKKLAPMHTLQYPTRLIWGSDGNLYVTDYANNAVFICDSARNITGELKKLDKPLGVATDAAGNIYVGNQGRKNVEVYDSLGNLLRTVGDGSIAMPNDLALDRDNNLYVLDSANDLVLVYDEAGNLTSTIGDSSRIGYAMSLAISYHGDAGSEEGELYVADQAKSTIHVFAMDGSYKKSIGSTGSLYTTNWDGKFSALVAVFVDRYGNVHGLDNNLNVVQVFEPQNGTFLHSYNAYPPENEYRLNLQMDITIHPADNRVMVANLATRSVETVTTITAP
jgi:hypothetical protein